MTKHHEDVVPYCCHPPAFWQSDDPFDDAANDVQPGAWWMDTTAGYVLKRRTDANDGWTTVSGDLSSAGTGINETLLDAKGDLIAASAADTAAKLTVGADGTILVAASGQTTGLQWQSLATAGIAALASPTFTGTPSLPTGTTAVTQTAGNNSTAPATTAYADNAVAKQPEILEYALSDETTAITTGLKLTTRAPFAMTVTNVRISLTTASGSGNPAVDVKESGTTIFSTTPKIDSGELTNVTGTAAVISDASIADDAELTFIVDTAGSGAKGLKCRLYVTRA